jgi:hypothetical protein
LSNKVLTLVRLEDNSLFRLTGDFEFVGSELSAFEAHGSGHVGSNFFEQPVGRPRRYKPNGVVLQGPCRSRRGGKTPHLSGDLRVSRFLHQPIVKTIHLPLGEPMALVLQFVVFDPSVVENVVQLNRGVELLDVLHIVLDQPAVVKGILNACCFACWRTHRFSSRNSSLRKSRSSR